MQKILRSILIKPIGSFCNLRCDYCFYLDKHRLYEGAPSTHRMNELTLTKLIKEMFMCSPSPTFLWQGGEPMVLGLNFFQKVVEMQKFYAKGRLYANALQTSGILLDEAWADFLLRENFLVGISLDGPESIHDRYRRDLQGKGTFRRVFENAKMLLEKGVPVNLLATVNDYSVQFPKEIYQFFMENQFIFMQFSPIVEPDPQNLAVAAPYSVNAQDYGRFLVELFNLWEQDFDFEELKQKSSIRFFDSLIQKYIGRMPDHCAFHERCNDYLVVEHNGDLFSCDFLVAEETRIGNLHEISLKEAFQSPAHTAFGERKADFGIECRQCQWLNPCYGGCIKDRINDPRDQGHHRFCESYRWFFEQTDSRFKKLAELYHQYYDE
ncbi:MAG: anaerobic sulfatase maturase [Beggiatoa sp. IS2]|nr:MAG: anaerobic sulfatase maturase [Beggiatoa sp. IS2]